MVLFKILNFNGPSMIMNNDGFVYDYIFKKKEEKTIVAIQSEIYVCLLFLRKVRTNESSTITSVLINKILIKHLLYFFLFVLVYSNIFLFFFFFFFFCYVLRFQNQSCFFLLSALSTKLLANCFDIIHFLFIYFFLI